MTSHNKKKKKRMYFLSSEGEVWYERGLIFGVLRCQPLTGPSQMLSYLSLSITLGFRLIASSDIQQQTNKQTNP